MIGLLNNQEFLVGAIITIVSTVVGIVYKYNRPSEISFIPLKFVSLIDDILNQHSDIKILLNENEINKNICLLKGCFYNSGKDDIDFKSFEKRLKIQLPEGSEVLKSRIYAKSTDLSVNISDYSRDFIEFDGGLFKRKEYFSFDSIISLPNDLSSKHTNGDKIYSIIDFDLRTKNLKIKKENTSFNSNSDKKYRLIIISILVILGIKTIFESFNFPLTVKPLNIHSKEISYSIITPTDHDSIFVRITPFYMGKDSIIINGINNNYSDTISLDTFHSELMLKARVSNVMADNQIKEHLKIWKLINALPYLFLLISMIYVLTLSWRKEKRNKLFEEKITNANIV